MFAELIPDGIDHLIITNSCTCKMVGMNNYNHRTIKLFNHDIVHTLV